MIRIQFDEQSATKLEKLLLWLIAHTVKNILHMSIFYFADVSLK